MGQITFQTSCYNNSYRLLLEDGLLEHYLSLFPEKYFSKIQVMINNVFDKRGVEKMMEKFSHVKHYFPYEESKTVMDYFDMPIDEYIYGMQYSIQHFTGVYYCDTEYLFHVSEDCNIDNLNSDFVSDCMDILQSKDNYITALPNWTTDPTKGAKDEAMGEDGKFFIARGFTDQTYILKTNVFKDNKIYKMEHPDSNRYPPKGGNSFERRINSYMWCEDKYRLVHKEYNYIHGYYDNIIKGN